MTEKQPLVEFESAGEAAILNYNVPDSTSYSLRSTIELDYPDECFNEAAFREPEQKLADSAIQNKSTDELADEVEDGIRTGKINNPLLKATNVQNLQTKPLLKSKLLGQLTGTIPDGGNDRVMPLDVSELKQETITLLESRDYLSRDSRYGLVTGITPKFIAEQGKLKQYVTFSPNLYGDYDVGFIPEPPSAQPQLAIVEEYRVSNFLGDYGAGKTIKTHTLFPGEQTKMYLRTYKNNEREAQEASSILEEMTREAALDFENTLQREHATKVSKEKNRDSTWNLSGETSAIIPIAEGVNLVNKVGGGLLGSKKSKRTREEMAKTVTTAIQKHAQSKSTKRGLTVNSTSSFKEQVTEEESIERTIHNINLSRTLNLVFRQMNQEFLSLVHLVDLKVAFWNGFPNTYSEVPLSELEDLLDALLVEEATTEIDGEQQTIRPKERVKDDILAEAQQIYDHQDELHSEFVEQIEREDETSYWRVVPEYSDEYDSRMVDGIILSTTETTLRTDGVVVEALLGQGEALDSYSKELQEEAVRERRSQVDLTKAEIERQKLARDIIDRKDKDAAEVFEMVFHAPKKDDEDESDEE